MGHGLRRRPHRRPPVQCQIALVHGRARFWLAFRRALPSQLVLGALVALLLIGVQLQAPTPVQAALYTSAGTGDWATATTWTPNGVPNAGDDVVIAAGHTVTVSSSQAALGVTINGTGVLVVSSTLAAGASGITIDANGTLTNNGTVTNAGNLAVTSPGKFTNNGTASVTGTVTGTGTVLQGTSATLNLANAAAPTITTLNATTNTPNTVAFNGAGQAIGTYAYSNLTMSGSGAKTGTPTSVSGAFTLAGTATYSLTALTIGGDLNVQGGTLTIPGVAVTVTGNTTVSGGTLTITSATGAKTFSGDITINGGTWLNNTATVAVAVGGNLTYLSGTFTSGLGVYTLSGASKQITGPITIAAVTVTGAGLTLTGTNSIGALTVTSPGTVTNNGTLKISESLGVAAALAGTGTFTNGSSATLDLETTAVPAITTLNATANTTNTVRYTRAGAQTMRAIAYHHLTLAGSGAKTGGGAMTVNGTFTISDPATFTTGAFIHSFAGNFVNNSTAGTPVTATGSTLNFDTPLVSAATSISGTGASTLTFVTVNVNNVSGFSTSKFITATTVTVGGGRP